MFKFNLITQKILYSSHLKKFKELIHIYGKYHNLSIKDYGGFQSRNISTIKLIKLALSKHKNEINMLNINIFIFTGDSAEKAEYYRKILNIPFIFAYSTTDIYKNTVIPIPDFIFDSWIESGITSYEDIISKCIKSSTSSYIDEHCFWIGNPNTHPTRHILLNISKKFPNYISANSMQWLSSEKGKMQKTSQFVTLYDHAKYKYLIDVQGCGYSGRLKILFWLKRPIFIVKRQHQEFYFPKLKEWDNFIPVKEDLSDLIQKYEYIEHTPHLYNSLVTSGSKLANEYLTKNYALEYLYNTIKKYNLN